MQTNGTMEHVNGNGVLNDEDIEPHTNGDTDQRPAEESKPVHAEDPSSDDKAKDDEHHGEELVEGQEDDVIY